MSDAALQRLVEAFEHKGFKAQVGSDQLIFRGLLEVRGSAIPTRLVFENLEFAELPRLYIEGTKDIPRAVVAHLNTKRELCVVDRDRYVSDRYLIVEQSLGLLDRAKEVLARNWTNEAEREIAAEFPQHWGESSIKIALPSGYQTAWKTVRKSGLLQIVPNEPNGREKEQCAIVRTATSLSFTSDQPLPTILGELLDWAAYWDLNLANQIVHSLAGLHPNDPICVIEAPNGTIAFQIQLLERSQKLASVLSNHGAWKQYISSAQARLLKVRRLSTDQADLEHILSRGTEGVVPLRDKRVVLVGCGAIGGYLSHGIARLGAGFGSGKLALIDKETLSDNNIGRHLLGSDFLDCGKASSCKTVIDRDLPGLSVSARETPVERQRLAVTEADIVINATGEQGIGGLLNEWSLAQSSAQQRHTELLHVWLEGQGAVAFTHFSSDREFGCYRCLRPSHEDPPHYRALRKDAPTDLAGGCGEAPYTPYGPSAPMLAASLAVQHVLDWTRGKQRPLLRAIQIDLHRTNSVKPANPTSSARCPACANLTRV